jgi:hypothetical protein
MPNLRRLVALTNLSDVGLLLVSVYMLLGVKGVCDSLFTLVLMRPTKKMAALKHDIAVTMAMAFPPHHESDMTIYSQCLPCTKEGREQ